MDDQIAAERVESADQADGILAESRGASAQDGRVDRDHVSRRGPGVGNAALKSGRLAPLLPHDLDIDLPLPGAIREYDD